jgi:antagonist of KipI
MTIHVLEPGLCTLLVDYGRPSSRSLGVPVGGAADRFSLAIANALVGNPLDAPALEIALAGPVLCAEDQLGGVVFGAPFNLSSDRQPLKPGVTFTLQAGEEVRIGTPSHGMRAYFCVAGGIEALPILQSRSALQPLAAGAVLRCSSSALGMRFVIPSWKWNAEPNTLRILPGLQADWFAGQSLLEREYTVNPASNRMGLRLQGPPLPFPDHELVSEPVSPGTVQVTRDGRCIVLGVDCQTIGGYPKVAQVIAADLDKLGQLRPGERVRFIAVSLEEAEQCYREKQGELKEWLLRLRTAETL